MVSDDDLLLVGCCTFGGWGNRSGEGLYTFSGSDWTRINTSNCGLIDNSIRTIKIDNNNNKWIVPVWKNNNLIKFDGTNWTVYDSTNSFIDFNWTGIKKY